MEEEVKNTSESTQETAGENLDYIEALKEMKRTTVPKEAYEQLKTENAKLLKSLINGETIEGTDAPATSSIDELRKELFKVDGGLTNLEYARKALQLRDALLAEGQPDPFLPAGHDYVAEAGDIEAAERVAKIIKECIDYADGDSQIFTSELQRVMVDAAPTRRK